MLLIYRGNIDCQKLGRFVAANWWRLSSADLSIRFSTRLRFRDRNFATRADRAIFRDDAIFYRFKRKPFQCLLITLAIVGGRFTRHRPFIVNNFQSHSFSDCQHLDVWRHIHFVFISSEVEFCKCQITKLIATPAHHRNLKICDHYTATFIFLSFRTSNRRNWSCRQ